MTAAAWLLAPTAVVAPLPMHFAPPLATPLHYETVTIRDDGARKRRFTLVEQARFARAPGGYILSTSLERFAVDAEPAVQPVFAAAMQPFVGVVTVVAVSADGEPTAPIDADATWTQVTASLDAMIAKLAADPTHAPEMLVAARRFVAAFAAMPAAARRERLLESSRALLDFAGPTLAAGASEPFTHRSESPFGGTIGIGGTLRLVSADADQARFAIAARTRPADIAAAVAALGQQMSADLPVPARAAIARSIAGLGTLEIVETGEIIVSRRTGLMRSSRTVREVRVGSGPVQRTTKTIRLIDSPVS